MTPRQVVVVVVVELEIYWRLRFPFSFPPFTLHRLVFSFTIARDSNCPSLNRAQRIALFVCCLVSVSFGRLSTNQLWRLPREFCEDFAKRNSRNHQSVRQRLELLANLSRLSFRASLRATLKPSTTSKSGVTIRVSSPLGCSSSREILRVTVRVNLKRILNSSSSSLLERVFSKVNSERIYRLPRAIVRVISGTFFSVR